MKTDARTWQNLLFGVVIENHFFHYERINIPNIWFSTNERIENRSEKATSNHETSMERELL